MRSMTGYGRAVTTIGKRRVVVELRSVNHRFLEVKLRLPWSDATLDMNMTQLIRTAIDRGVISVNAREESGGSGAEVKLDVEIARSYHHALEQLKTELALQERVTLELLARQPGVLSIGEAIADPEELWLAIKPALQEALQALVESRTREGSALRADLERRTTQLADHLVTLRKRTDEQPEQYRRRLRERLDRILRGDAAGGVHVDPQRLAQEIAIFADRVDVSEELTRIEAHLVEFRRLLAEKGSAGRRLDFLTQEINREVNTVGSKAQSAEVSAIVVEAKAELERLREQIQNVE